MLTPIFLLYLFTVSAYDTDTTLLDKIIPRPISNRLKRGEFPIMIPHKQVTILFSDIVGFTPISESIPTKSLMLLLHDLFFKFDQLTIKHNVFKVETIGDAYMVVAGHDDSPHAKIPTARVLEFAQDMLRVASNIKIPNLKPRYCFFGDTVNVASRMESNGSPMHIHVSQPVVEQLRFDKQISNFVVRSRGEMEIKGKGRMSTYFVATAAHNSRSRMRRNQPWQQIRSRSH